MYFADKPRERKRPDNILSAKNIIISLRQTNHSLDEIKTILDSKGFDICPNTIYNILKEAGFKKLARRKNEIKEQLQTPQIPVEKSISLSFEQPEEFKSDSAVIICLLPFIEHLGIRKIIEESHYPGTKLISPLNSILSFVAL